MATDPALSSVMAAPESSRRPALLAAAMVAGVSLLLSLRTLSHVEEAQRWKVGQAMALGVALTALLTLGWVLVLAPGRDVRPRHAKWIALAVLIALQGSGLVHLQFLIAARADGWRPTEMLQVSEAVSFFLRLAFCGGAVWLALRVLAGPPRSGPIEPAALAPGRMVWVLLGLHQGAVFFLNALFLGQAARLGAGFTFGEQALGWWSAVLLVAAGAIAWLLRPSLSRKPGRWRWLLGFVVALLASALALLIALRVSWRALRIVELPSDVLLPASTLVWAFVSFGLVGALLSGRSKTPAPPPSSPLP